MHGAGSATVTWHTATVIIAEGHLMLGCTQIMWYKYLTDARALTKSDTCEHAEQDRAGKRGWGGVSIFLLISNWVEVWAHWSHSHSRPGLILQHFTALKLRVLWTRLRGSADEIRSLWVHWPFHNYTRIIRSYADTLMEWVDTTQDALTFVYVSFPCSIFV